MPVSESGHDQELCRNAIYFHVMRIRAAIWAVVRLSEFSDQMRHSIPQISRSLEHEFVVNHA